MVIEPGTPTGKNVDDYGVKRRMNIFNKLHKVVNEEVILDLGCGYGAYTRLIKNICPYTIGIDLLCQHITTAKHNYQDIDFLLMNGTNIAFKDNIFDVIYMIETIEHVEDENILLNEMCRIIKSKGIMILSLPNKYFPFELHAIKLMGRTIKSPIPFFSLLPERLRQNSQTARIYTERSIRKLLEHNGFMILRVEYITPVMDGRIQDKFKFFRKFFEFIEKSYFKKFFGISIVILAIKKNDDKK